MSLRARYLLAPLLLLGGACVPAGCRPAPARDERQSAAALAPVLRAVRQQRHLAPDEAVPRAALRAATREELRSQLELHAAGTYIGEVLADHDSALTRWPDRVAHPLMVWVQPSSAVAGWQPAFVQQVQSAFGEWQALGIPVRFLFAADSAAADVHVTWRDHFDEPISGKTLWARDGDWWIVEANIQLAIHHDGGKALDVRAVHALALHETGHLLGLDHTSDSSNIMAPRVRVRDLSPADRATVQLLYSLPPGSVK